MKTMSNIFNWIYIFIYFNEVIQDEDYILYVLNRKWQSGCEIRKSIRELGYEMSIACLYVTLNRLVLQNIIEEKIEQVYGKSQKKEQYVFKCPARLCNFLIA
jgi:hypothetical protein